MATTGTRCLLFLSVFFVGVYAYEPQLRCYFCHDCETSYKHTAKYCSPKFYFCVFLRKPDGSVNRYCGDFGNCTGLLEAGGNCSICSAALCNDEYRPNPSGGAVVNSVALSALLVTLLCRKL